MDDAHKGDKHVLDDDRDLNMGDDENVGSISPSDLLLV